MSFNPYKNPMRSKDFYEKRWCLCRLNETVDIKGMKHSACPVNGDHWAVVTWSAYGTGVKCVLRHQHRGPSGWPRLPGWPQAGWTACFPFLSIAAILIARSSPPWFIVDRPFLFFIRHNPTGRWFSSSTVHELLEFRKVDGQLNPTVLLLVCFYVATITNTSNNITNHPSWKSGCVYKVMESFKQGQDFRFVLFCF